MSIIREQPKRMRRAGAGFNLLLAVATGMAAGGCGAKNVQVSAADSLGRFVDEAKSREPAETSSDGSLWTSQGRYSNLFRDFKARDVDDIVTIRVYEQTQASASADAQSGKEMDAELGISNFLGLEKGIKELPNLVAGSGTSAYKGEGSTTRDTALSTTITARVIDVLPNGYLVVRGVREVRLNDENQVVYLSGIVRPEDITANNVVSSAAIAELEVRVEGRGVVSEPLKPGWLYKILSGIMPF